MLYDHVQKLIQIPCKIYVDFETVLKAVSTCNDNPEPAYTIEVNKRAACGFSSFVKYSYDTSKNKQYFIKDKTT